MKSVFLKQVLSDRGIAPQTARTCHLHELSAAETRIAVGAPLHMKSDSIAIPYCDIHGKETGFLRVKLRNEFETKDTNGKSRTAKYLQPEGTANRLYLSPLIDWQKVASDSSIPILFTEGELKAVKLSQHQHACIGVSGVWNWRKRDDDESSALNDFNQFDWTGRRIYIVFDSDVRTNRNVAKARMALARELYTRGAKPYLVDLPHIKGATKTGVDDWWCALGRSAKKKFLALLHAATSPFVPSIKTTTEIAKQELPEIDWVVPGLLSRGLASLSANPKTGKSFVALQIAYAVATGKPALGHYSTNQGEVLVLALEDNDRRIKVRMNLMGLAPSSALRIATSWPPGDDGYAALDRTLDEYPKTRLVIIDTLQRFRKVSTSRGQNVYEADYVELALLKGIADRHELCVLLIHHRNKAPKGEDIFSSVSGSAAITGAPDTNMVVVRQRGSGQAILHTSGRDIEETSFSVSINEKLVWTIEGEAFEHSLSAEREAILAILLRVAGPVGLRDIADDMEDELGKTCSTQNARKMLRGLIKSGHVSQPDKGMYVITDEGRTMTEESAKRIRKLTGG